jgi:protein O-GlcNAc transferase
VSRRLGNALLAGGCCAEAVSCLRGAVTLEPGNVRGHNNLGQALVRLGRYAEAMASYQRALELDPGYAIAYHNLGVVHYQQHAFEAAVACYRQALQRDPSCVATYRNCGDALQQLGRFAQAVASYERALELEPDHAEALSNCASALLALKRPEEALRHCERAIALQADLAQAYSNLAGALRKLNRLEEAASACERALQLKPDYPAALSNLANVMLAGNRCREALEWCDRAIALQPSLLEAHEQRALALLVEKRPQEAVASYARLLQIDPQYRFAPGAMLGAQLSCCDWGCYERSCAQITHAVAAGRPVISAFTFLAISDCAELQLRCARTCAAEELPQSCRSSWSGERYRHEKIRVAYLSADFHQHATAVLTAGLFEAHDRQRLEITAISFGPHDCGAMRQRLVRAFDQFIDVRHMSDAQAAELLRTLEIDIAVDLKGYTADARPGILARRAAPIQVGYLGYPGTMGLEQIDYLLADRIVLPPEERTHYTEQVVYLPDCYQVNDACRAIGAHTPSRAALGLPASGFVFCCFNNHYKITPGVFDIWMRLLRQVPGSVLWLLEDNPVAAANLRREAAARGVDAGRLVFAARLPPEEHLARHRLADLFLDTLPYNAHTTASDALWAGLPVLTCMGRAFPGRVAASLLHALGLPELVSGDLDEYAARALELAMDPEQLAALRARLSENRSTHPLFDTARFCRQLEAAYTTMWQRRQQGLSPCGFAVEPWLSQKRNPAPAS